MEKELYREMYDQEVHHWWFRAKRRIILNLIRSYMEDIPHPRFLDVGCGTGAMLKELEGLGETVGIDASDEALAFAATRTRARLIKGRVPKDLYNLDEEFDFVLMLDLLEHLDDDLGALEAASSVLCKNGIVLITVPAFQWLFAPRDLYHHHRRRYHKSELDSLLVKASFNVEYLSYYNFFLFPLAAAQRLISRFFGSRPARDLTLPPPLVNKTLELIFSSERLLMPRVSFPWGLSLISVVRRPGSRRN